LFALTDDMPWQQHIQNPLRYQERVKGFKDDGGSIQNRDGP